MGLTVVGVGRHRATRTQGQTLLLVPQTTVAIVAAMVDTMATAGGAMVGQAPGAAAHHRPVPRAAQVRTLLGRIVMAGLPKFDRRTTRRPDQPILILAVHAQVQWEAGTGRCQVVGDDVGYIALYDDVWIQLL